MCFSNLLFLTANFFGVELLKHDELEDLHINSTVITSNIRKSSLVVLQFRAERDKAWDEDAVLRYEQAIAEHYMRLVNICC